MVDLSISPWREILAIAGGIAMTSGWIVAYFARRRIERIPEKDAIDLKMKALDLHQKMKDANLTQADLDKLASEMSRRQHVRQIEDNVASRVAEQRSQDGPAPGGTQAEMNTLSAADLRVAKSMLERAVTEAEMYCQEEEGPTLDSLHKAQAAWEKYSKAEAQFRAAIHAGGTMHPLVLHSELERLTVARIADLKAYIEWRKTL